MYRSFLHFRQAASCTNLWGEQHREVYAEPLFAQYNSQPVRQLLYVIYRGQKELLTEHQTLSIVELWDL